MKAYFLVILAAATLCVLTVRLARTGPDIRGVTDPELRELRNQIVALQSRVRALEQRSSEQRSAADALEQGHKLPGIPYPAPSDWPEWPSSSAGIPPKSPMQPKIWGEREINGWTFYLIPCARVSSPSIGPDAMNFK
jgi:hypothetical protein